LDLTYTQEYEDFRLGVREFLSSHWSPGGDGGSPEEIVALRRKAIERGYLARSVPRAYGGSEQPPDPLRSAVIYEEFVRVAAPRDIEPPGAQLIPTLLAHGSEEQKRSYLPRTLTGELVWCQGYSEPGAGSDLASVQTRAELVGSEWVIHGQKIWTSYAHEAQMIYMLVRTELEAGKHAGLSYLLVDMDREGIEVRPLQALDGDSHFNAVFFDGVRVPADRIVGKRGQGWVVSRSTLAAERDLVGLASNALDHWRYLLGIARRTVRAGRPAIEDPELRRRLVEIEGYVMSHEYSSYRQLTSAARGRGMGLIGTMNKLVTTEIISRISRLAIEIEAEAGLGSPTPRRGTGWQAEPNALALFLRTPGYRTAGGTSNVQRNIIGEHGLGLPRDSAVLRNAGKR